MVPGDQQDRIHGMLGEAQRLVDESEHAAGVAREARGRADQANRWTSEHKNPYLRVSWSLLC